MPAGICWSNPVRYPDPRLVETHLPQIGRRRVLGYMFATSTLAAAGTFPSPARASLPRMGRSSKDLSIGLSAPLTSFDPHAHSYSPNLAFSQHIFDPLIEPDGQMGLRPALASSWTVTPDGCRLWLREGIRFHDGTPVTAEDAAASIRRVLGQTGRRFGLASKLAGVTDVRTEGPATLFLKTKQPLATLPRTLTAIAIIPARFEHAPTEAFDSGQVLIGSGPFRYISGTLKSAIELTAAPGHWSGMTHWNTVKIQVLNDSAARVTALVTGQVDLIHAIPPADTGRLMANKAVRVISAPSDRVIYLGFDHLDRVPPHAYNSDGTALTVNPFRDARVRRAISLAIDRQSIVREILLGLGQPANQPVAPTFKAANPDLPVLTHDLSRARALLSAAGWEKGFRLVLHCPTGRYVEDVAIARTVAIMLTRIGIDTTVAELEPLAFFNALPENSFSAYLSGIGSSIGDTADVLRALLMTKNKQNAGGINTGWSDPVFDQLVEDAQKTIDEPARITMLQQALARQADAMAIVPLHVQMAVWAMSQNIDYPPRTDGRTLAQSARWAGT